VWRLFSVIFFPWIRLVSHFHKPTPKMNPCFLLENPEQTPLAGSARVGVAHRRREVWRLPVRPLEAVLRGHMCRCVRQAPAQPLLGRGPKLLHRVVHLQTGGPHGHRQRRWLSGCSGRRIRQRRRHDVQLIIHLKLNLPCKSLLTGQRPWILVRWDDDRCWRCVSVLEQDVCRGVAHPVVQRLGVLPRWWPRGALRLAAQPRVIGTRHVVCFRRLLYQGLWRHLSARGDAKEDRQQWPLAIVGVAFMPVCLYFSSQTHTLAFFCLNKRVWWCVPDDWQCTRELLPTSVARALQWWDHANRGIYRSLYNTDGCNVVVKPLN
jgi:hypothetical protein